MKVKCCNCKEPKELNIDNFYKSKTSANGFSYECKSCSRSRARKHKGKYDKDRDLHNLFL